MESISDQMERISHIWQLVETQIKLKTRRKTPCLLQTTKTPLTHEYHLPTPLDLLDHHFYRFPHSSLSLWILTSWDKETERKDQNFRRRRRRPMKDDYSSISLHSANPTTHAMGLSHTTHPWNSTPYTSWIHEDPTWDSTASLSALLTNQWQAPSVPELQNSHIIFWNPTLPIWTIHLKHVLPMIYYSHHL